MSMTRAQAAQAEPPHSHATHAPSISESRSCCTHTARDAARAHSILCDVMHQRHRFLHAHVAAHDSHLSRVIHNTTHATQPTHLRLLHRQPPPCNPQRCSHWQRHCQRHLCKRRPWLEHWSAVETAFNEARDDCGVFFEFDAGKWRER